MKKQEPAAPPPYRSPDVTDDGGRVVLRTYAPNARVVRVSGEWDGWKAHDLTRGENGVWSVTIGPLPADLYEYRFNVDGQDAVDIKNPQLRPFTNLLEVTRGKSDLFWQPQPGLRGSIHTLFYDSRAASIPRRVHVYTPPGYEDSPRRRYPTLYLLHGSGDDDSSWSSGLGRANVIVDNLIRDGKMPPMVVVMPDGHVRAPGKTFPPTAFGDDLVGDLVPLIDKRFRTNRERSICGLSMGGAQTVTVGMAHPELFHSFGIFSAGVRSEAPGPFDSAIATLAAARGGEKPGPLVWIAIGKEDFLFERCQTLKQKLTAAKLSFTYVETAGGHVWHNWRAYLAQFASLAFRPRK